MESHPGSEVGQAADAGTEDLRSGAPTLVALWWWPGLCLPHPAMGTVRDSH